MVQAPARWVDPVRGEPAQEIRGHLSVRLRDRALERAVGRAAVDRAVLGGAGGPHLPRRQPAHETARVLGMADRGAEEAIPRGDPALGGVHAAEGDVQARQGRVHPVVHILRLAQHRLRAVPVLHRAGPAADSRVLAAQPVAEHARHPHRVPAAGRPAGIPGSADPGRDPRRELRHLRSGLRPHGEPAEGAGLRGIPRLREVPGPELGRIEDGQPPRADHDRQPDPARESRTAIRPRSSLPSDRERSTARVFEEHARQWQRGPDRGQRRPAPRPAGHGQPAAGGARHRARPAVPGPRADHRGALPVERPAQLRRAEPLVDARPDLPVPAPRPQRARFRVFPVIETTPAAARRRKVEVQLEEDPLWYKDALVYELHVRAFMDSDADGSGDFRGLIEKLPYLQELGINALWLLPFYPSPLRDDGYDIADYTNVNPMYGTLGDANQLVREAHRRGIRVINELVCNHTSDQHPWFQRARRAKPGTAARDFYVWSETNQKYQDVRIIFKDFETSNWTWDHVANAYYWHRFYSSQPDLNFDNPKVKEALFKVLDFWMDAGIDGVRLDAVPYLYEREGTNGENLPETHDFLRELRHHVDSNYKNRMLLAEANQWPEDSVAYFGKGDECHMSFHFPLMPRLFMAIRMEDRFPIVDILAQTPAIPDTSQWALLLRNHDELTLEMVTDEERDYMYRAYTQDRLARLNLGIRRRLAPLLGNDRRRIELMNGLLYSLPGTPVLYYGDEIGMGDNIFLGDRNGVRTPMQWSADRNAGFSRANPQRLYLPIIIDPEYRYEAVNVEAQQNNGNSLLWWMKRLISFRKRSKVFGRGSLEILPSENRKVLAFVRRYQDEAVFVVANLSRFAQSVDLDLSAFKGRVPLELFGQTRFPPVSDAPYSLTLGPHIFYWFALPPQSVEAVAVAGPTAAP